MAGYNGAWTGQQIDEAIGQIANKNIPTSSVITPDGTTVENILSKIPKKIHAYIRVMDINGLFIRGLNTNYDNSANYWDVEFDLRDNGDLILPHDVTLYLDEPGNNITVLEMDIEFPGDDQHVFDPVQGSGVYANLILWSSSGSYNVAQEKYIPINPGSIIDLGHSYGHRITMVRGWWGRLADV